MTNLAIHAEPQSEAGWIFPQILMGAILGLSILLSFAVFAG
jgi:hypothetical protein